MGDRPLTVVVAPDSFKGSLSSVEVAEALAHGWRAARPTDVVLLAPLADGGEGTLAAIAAAGGWELASAAAHDPVGRPIDAPWLRSPDGSSAVIELAAASGISRLGPGERDALGASTRGTGEILRCVLDSGARSIMLGIGGSATTDGGWGIVAALGGRLQEIEDAEAEPADGADHPRPVRVDLSALDPRLAEVELRVACDVTNPLLGEHGAAATYGPQKGAAPSDVIVLDGELARFADALEAATGRRERLTPGAGAAGGVGFALLCLQDRFRSFALRPGVELVMEATGFAAKLAQADLVLTGEGSIDAQTAFGKTALGVATRARNAGVGCIAVAGSVHPDGARALARVGAIALPVVEGPLRLEAAMAAGRPPIERAAERVARLIALGLERGTRPATDATARSTMPR